MGIEADLLPATLAEGRDLLRTILLRQAAPSEAGRLLAKALIQTAEKMLPGKLFDQAPVILLRHLAGADLADMLGVARRRTIWHWLLPLFLRRWIGLIERLEEHPLPLGKLMDRISAVLVRKMLGLFIPYKDQHFCIPETVQTHWGMK